MAKNAHPQHSSRRGATKVDPRRIHAVPPEKSAYRRWFSSLNPSLQLVFLQLWMPLFMAVMFVLCYVGAFQSTAPREVPIGVIGQASAVEQYQDVADEAAPGAWSFVSVKDGDTAQEQVRSGEIAAAYDVGGNALIVASAHQAQAANLIPAALGPLLNPDQPPQKSDVAPLPTGDVGMTPMYLMLAWCISGYLAAMFIGLMGGPLRRRTRLAVILGVSFVLSFVTCFLASPVLGAIEGHFWQLWGLGWMWALAIGLAVNGLSYFCGRFIAAPAMTIFIFLSIPASGAAFPEWFMPEPFRALNHVVVGSGITEMLKRLLYDVGPGYSRGWIMLACYAVVGILLTLVGKRYWEWQRVRRMLRGKTTMMQDAQRASGRQHERDREAILDDFGLKATTGGIIVQQNPALSAPETPPSGSPASGDTDTTSMWALGGPLEQELTRPGDARPGEARPREDRENRSGDDAGRG